MSKRQCFICEKEALFKCSRCKIGQYCSEECQRYDWDIEKHSLECRETIDLKLLLEKIENIIPLLQVAQVIVNKGVKAEKNVVVSENSIILDSHNTTILPITEEIDTISSIEKDRATILALAKQPLNGSPSIKMASTVAKISSFWDSIRAWVSSSNNPTTPKVSRLCEALTPTPLNTFEKKNVYCCMASGNKDLSVAASIVDSSRICRTDDERISGKIVAGDVTLLVHSGPFWLRSSTLSMSRLRHRAYALSPSGDMNNVSYYLPSVWDEDHFDKNTGKKRSWSAEELVESLTRKALSHHNLKFASKIEIWELPCYIVGDSVLNETRHDWGFFSTAILSKTVPFYKKHLKENELAYELEKSSKNSFLPSYKNRDVWVRTFADIAAFVKLTRLLGNETESNLRALVNHALEDFQSFQLLTNLKEKKEKKEKKENSHHDSSHDIAGKLMMLIAVERNDLFASMLGDVAKLILGYRQKYVEVAFANPQIVLALCKFLIFSDEQLDTNNNIPAKMKEEIKEIIRDFLFDRKNRTRDAFLDADSHIFAANWYLQAVFAAKTIDDIRVDKKTVSTFVERAQELCKIGIKLQRSITEEACSAHGLLVSHSFNYTEFDWLAESWARWQNEWISESRGGFRYYVDEPSYRTDVTSHVVEVCLLLLNEE